jgi:hypothetical protein
VELAVLSGHPEEVYGLKFIGSSSTAGSSSAAAAAAQQHAGQPPSQQPSISDGSVTNTLVTASGESLFLWDLHAGQMLQECAPVPVAGMSGLNMNGDRPSQRKSSTKDSTRQQQAAAAAGDADRPPAGLDTAAMQQQQQQQQMEQHGSVEALKEAKQQQQQQEHVSTSEEEEDEDDGEEEEEPAAEGDDDDAQEGPPLLSYIFSLAAAEGTAWLAGSCADGMLRLWDAGQGCLQEVAGVQVSSGILHQQ